MCGVKCVCVCVCGVECVHVLIQRGVIALFMMKSSSLFKFHRRPNPSLCVIAYLIFVRIISSEE